MANYRYSGSKLISWIIKQCKRCGRFIHKKNCNPNSYCPRCSKIIKHEYNKDYQRGERYREHRRIYEKLPERKFYAATKQYVRRHLNDLEVGDIF